MATINMALKEPFFEQIQRGVKTTEYREITDYWIGKLLDTDRYTEKDADTLRQKLIDGSVPVYPKGWTDILFHCKGRTLSKKILDIKVYRGHSLFAIKLG